MTTCMSQTVCINASVWTCLMCPYKSCRSHKLHDHLEVVEALNPKLARELRAISRAFEEPGGGLEARR